MRYVLLIVGFLIVIVLADIMGEANRGIIVSVGGAIVYMIFSATKPRE